MLYRLSHLKCKLNPWGSSNNDNSQIGKLKQTKKLIYDHKYRKCHGNNINPGLSDSRGQESNYSMDISWESCRNATEINQRFNSEIKRTSLAFFSKINFKVYIKEISYLYKRNYFCTERVTEQVDLYGPLQLVNLQISSKWSELYWSGLTPFRLIISGSLLHISPDYSTQTLFSGTLFLINLFFSLDKIPNFHNDVLTAASSMNRKNESTNLN